MKTNERLIAELMHQRDLLSDLVSELEVRETLTVEDYAYCESCVDEITKKLKDIRRSALDKMIQGAPWFQTVSL
jgi:ribosome assembly protein YihI (activator of Der GTPase)